MNTHWSLGVLVGLPVAALFAALFILGLVGGIYSDLRGYDRYGYGWPIGRVAWVWSIPGLLVTLLITGATMYPFGAEYHQWRGVDGTIDTVSSRILGNGDSVDQRFVVRFTDGTERSCDDSRCSLLKAGDYLALSCKKHWQFAGTDGYDCNYVASRSKR